MLSLLFSPGFRWFFLLIAMSAGPAMAADWKPLPREVSSIGISGDDEFVTKRQWQHSPKFDIEQLNFYRGWLSRTAGHSGHRLTEPEDLEIDLVRIFRRDPRIARYRIKVTEQEVGYGKNRYGAFAWLSKWGEKGGCVIARQYIRKPGQSIDEVKIRIDARSCSSEQKQPSRVSFLLGLMERLEIQD